jgi:hypothetical protein
VLLRVRPVALGRKNALFAGADSGGEHWALVATLIQTAKLNKLDPLSMAARIRLCPARDACRVGFASVGPRRAEGRQPSWRC